MTPYLVPQSFFDRLGPGGAALVADRERFARYGALVRMRALACLMSARHGWLGASFSCVEILAALHHLFVPDPRLPLSDRPRIVLSKGHAAAGHYALLSALGAFPPERLLTYKDEGGLPAHVERGVPGIDAGSGSLGQGVSKAVGMALAARAHGIRQPAFVLLGDGELQEGQVFESLLTLATKNLGEVIPVLDRNGLQTDSSTGDIKDAADWPAIFRGIGLRVIECDGHDGPALAEAFAACRDFDTPRIVIARTEKGFGTSLTRMARGSARRTAVWHGKIPDAAEYAAMMRELAEGVGCAELQAEVETALQASAGAPPPTAAASPLPSTADAFGRALVDLGARFESLHVLDADLEKSCRLSAFADAYPARFHEMGISEQDMVSTACGIALAGGVAVANTYAAFHRRALDQAFCAGLDGAAVILAGHYAGLDYHTDGRTHQSLTDVALFRALGFVDVYEPLTARETGWLLETLVAEFDRRLAAGLPCRPAYLRLHRSAPAREILLPAERFEGVYEFRAGERPAPTALVAASPHFLAAALDLQARLREECRLADVIGVSSYDARGKKLSRLLAGRERIFTFESHSVRGGLACMVAERTSLPVHRFGTGEPSGCARTHDAALEGHGLSTETLHVMVRAMLKG